MNVLSKPVIKWSAEQDEKLIALVEKHNKGKKLNWRLVAMKMGSGFKNKMCLCRFRKLTVSHKSRSKRAKSVDALKIKANYAVRTMFDLK